MYWLRWLAVGFVAGVLFVLMIIPPVNTLTPAWQSPLLSLDTWLHLGDFTLFGLVLANSRPTKSIALTWGLASAYGIGLEFLQLAIPYRAFSLVDIGADLAGAAFGVGLWILLSGALTELKAR